MVDICKLRVRTKQRTKSIMLVLLFISSCLLFFNNIITDSRIVAAQSSSWKWYKVETHYHTFWSDGSGDIWMAARDGLQYGYDAVFTTDHNALDKIKEGKYWGNNKTFLFTLGEDESWDNVTGAGVNYSKLEYVTDVVYSGSKSLHFALNTTSADQITLYKTVSLPWDAIVTISFVVNFTPVFSKAGLQISILTPTGINGSVVKHKNGTVYFCKEIKIDFDVNAYRFTANKTTPTVPIGEYSFRYNFLNTTVANNTWVKYTFNLTKFIEDFDADYKPEPIPNTMHLIRLEIFIDKAESTLFEGYIDDFVVNVTLPVNFAQSLLDKYEWTNNYYRSQGIQVYCGSEISEIPHMNVFYYNSVSDVITVEQQLSLNNSGVVQEVHNKGWLIQQNHPTGYSAAKGWNYTELVLDNNAWGADLIEARSNKELELWDTLLSRGVIILGMAGSDTHTGFTEGLNTTYIYAASNSRLDIFRSMFEGRMFMGLNNFSGILIFNIKESSEPYPARYPIYISKNVNATLYVKVNGTQNGWKLCWIRNGTYILNETITSTSFEKTRIFTLPDKANYFRIEVRDQNDKLIAWSEPIFFIKKTTFPTKMYYYISSIITPDKKNYNNEKIKGTTSIDFTDQRLHVVLQGPTGVTGTTVIYCPYDPIMIFEDGELKTTGYTWNPDTKLLTVNVTFSSPVELDVYFAVPRVESHKVEGEFLGYVFPGTQTIELNLQLYSEGSQVSQDTRIILEVYNIDGVLIYTTAKRETLTQETKTVVFNVPDLEPGTYLVKVTLQNPDTGETLNTYSFLLKVTYPSWLWFIIVIAAIGIATIIIYKRKGKIFSLKERLRHVA